MNILSQLSSRVKDRTEASNRKVVIQCLEDPLLLEEIETGLKSGDTALMGDCAEVFTQVAQDHPEYVAPYGKALSELITSKNSRVRWEAVHALALITPQIPAIIEPLIPNLGEMIEHDTSVIVRDYTVDILSNYPLNNPQAARLTVPYLKKTLTVWDGKHAARAIPGLVQVAAALPDLKGEIQELIQSLLDSPKGVVRKAAKNALKSISG